MKPITRRTIAAVGGLLLGWLAAGFVPGLTLSPLHAEEQPHHDAGRDAADLLVPAPDHVGWYKPVVWTIIGLFSAAVLIGIPTKKLKGPEPVEEHDHDDHH